MLTEKKIFEIDINVLECMKANIQITKNQSFSFLNKNLIKGRRYLRTCMHYLLTSKNESGNKSESISERLMLICCFIQGSENTINTLLDGRYIQTSILLKQEYEIFTRCLEIRNNKAKYGKTPNPSIHAGDLNKIYGLLNDISHISKHDIIQLSITTVKTNERNTVSPSVTFKKDFLHSLFEIHLFIYLNMTIEYIILFGDMYTEDCEEIENAMIYLNKACQLLDEMTEFKLNEKYFK